MSLAVTANSFNQGCVAAASVTALAWRRNLRLDSLVSFAIVALAIAIGWPLSRSGAVA